MYFGCVNRPLKPVELDAPYKEILLWVRLDHDDYWRFHSWEAPKEMNVPDEPPGSTLSIGFARPRDAARFFSRVLTSPAEVVPPARSLSPGRMDPSPAVDYYWPPTLMEAIAHHDQEMLAHPEQQVPVDRVFILGAGFSASFGYSTARDIVSGALIWAENYCQSHWIQRSCDQVKQYLKHYFPEWRSHPPSLYEFLDTFFPKQDAYAAAAITCSSDPLGLAEQRISWEDDNCESWYEEAQAFPEDDGDVLPAFEGLLATYLIAGLKTGEVLAPWTRSFVKNLRPSDVILTFNWDVIMEALMVNYGVPFCRYDWTPSRVKLIKLHGSADLLGTPNHLMKADAAYNPERFECATKYLWRARTSLDVLARTHPVPLGRMLWPAERYNKAGLLIMPPRYPLGYGFQLIQFNWQKALTALKRAREVYIIGYSLPAADVAFHHLVARISWSREKMVHVWNPDPVVGARATEMFGTHVMFHPQPAAAFQAR